MSKAWRQKLYLSGLIVLLLILSACNTPETREEQTEPADPVVARVNELEFTQTQLDQELAFDRAVYLLTAGRELTQQNPQEKLDRLTTSLLIDQQAQTAGVAVSEAEITAALMAFVEERNSSVEALEAALRGQGYTLADFRENVVARSVRAEKYLTTVILAGAETQAAQQEKLAAWLTDIQNNAKIEILYEPPPESPTVGAIAPNFSLTDLKGETVTLSQFRGQPVVINFWATWCVPCRKEIPAFQRAFEAHQTEGLVILAVNQKEEASLVEPYVAEFDLSFEILYDADGAVSKTYQVTGLPRTVFVDRQGVIKHIQIGEIQEVVLQGLLDRIL
jgi:peroxiredoxin